MTTTIEPPNADMQAAAASPPPRRRRVSRLAIVGALATLVVAIGAFFLVRALAGGGEDTVKGSSAHTYNLSVPDGWKALGEDELAALPGKPAGVVRREDGKGFLVIRREGRPPQSIQDFSKELDREFRKRVPDFQKRTTRSLKIRAGQAFFYSYIRRKKGTVHSVVLVPAPRGSYVLNTVASGGEDDVARELGKMIVSFDS